MTLITYPTRVHFADDILEEALHSELESADLRHPLLIGAATTAADELRERVLAGLPRGVAPLLFALPLGTDAADAVDPVRDLTQGRRVDVILTYGTPEAIVLGRKCRKMLSSTGPRPALYVVPGVDGLPDPCTRSVERWTNGLPDVLICDPTVLHGASPESRIDAAVRSLVRGVESYLAAAWNPTADGMALDAFNRCVVTMPQIAGATDTAVPREIMAAALTAAFSQQKGLGPTQRLTATLMAEHAGLDPVAVARLLLPGAVAAMQAERGKTDLLSRILGKGRGGAPDRLRDFLADVPGGPGSLSALGVTRAEVAAAATAADIGHVLPEGAARAVLDAVW